MPKSGYLDRQQKKIDNYIHSAEHLTRQFMADTLQMVMHQEYGWGYDRILELCLKWEAMRMEYKKALHPKDPEADVAQEHMDRVMAQIIRGKQALIPFSVRYEELKKVRYDR